MCLKIYTYTHTDTQTRTYEEVTKSSRSDQEARPEKYYIQIIFIIFLFTRHKKILDAGKKIHAFFFGNESYLMFLEIINDHGII